MDQVRSTPVNQKLRIYILRAVFILILPLILFVQPKFAIGTFEHEVVEAIGILFLLAGVFGRFWSILYVGAVKNQTVMTDGPYSMTRNPLYVFSTIAMTGIGLMLGAAFFAILIGGATFAILYVTAKKEAGFLLHEFGDDYRAYAERVPFFWPNPRLYRTAADVSFNARSLRNNLFDALGFLVAIPIVELIDQFKSAYGWSLFSVF
jgi:protein-S-isoprenylcysteine O-methyltransferase Ste14